MSWSKLKLGELTRIRTGKLDANAADEDGKYPFFTCAVKPLLINTPAFDCKAVLIAGNGDLNVKYHEGKFNAYQRTYVIESIDANKLHSKYLYYFLSDYIVELRELSIGGVIKYIKLGNLTDARIPLPPLAEQKRIAAVLDKANEIKLKRELALAKLDELAQSTFIEMFGTLFNDASIKLKDVCHRVTDGTHQSPKWESDGIPFLFISNIVDNQITLDTNKFISIETYKQLTKNCAIEVGDILYTTVGSYGNVAIVKNENKFCFQRHIAQIKPNQKLVTPNFLAVMLRSEFIRQQVDKVAKGVAQKTVNLSDLSKLDIICPSIKEQQNFNKVISEIDIIKNKFTAYKIKSINTISSLQNQAFSTGFNA